jgi:hypothetical protein
VEIYYFLLFLIALIVSCANGGSVKVGNFMRINSMTFNLQGEIL